MSNNKYLLYHNEAIEAFKERFRDKIQLNAQNYTDWINSLDLYVWNAFYPEKTSEADIEFVVGLLCILYIAGDINISFNNEADMIQRQPGNDSEFEEYWARPSGVYVSPEQRMKDRIHNHER